MVVTVLGVGMYGGDAARVRRCNGSGGCKYVVHEERRKACYIRIGRCRTVVDYFLIRKKDRKVVRNVNVIQGEACIPQHKLLLCVLDLNGQVRNKKEPFMRLMMYFSLRCRTGRL